ncbi:PTS transporter subunit EIIC [uncultured Lactobacillus sp.]|uniref:PTS transporter subunit EIIC n=1 Tax=uncultured Lactobacillus sp. TaxID=153152 RepID=UPI0025ED3C3D|nr:PTS transporter subunit EIIC [uncultured Lactobacillus sp.]
MYNELVENIVKYMGGKINIASHTHCMTRLRITAHDDTLVQSDKIKNLKGVMGVVKKGNQWQIVIGPTVEEVYNSFASYLNNSPSEEGKNIKEQHSKGTWGANVLNTVAGIFNPIVPALAGSGLIKAILALCLACHWLTDKSQTYIILNVISDGVFNFLPFLLAYSSSKIFKMNTAVALGIAGAMLHPTFIQYLTAGKTTLQFFGITMHLVDYQTSVLPIILVIWFASYLEKFLNKVIPKAIKIIVVPAFTLLFATPIALLIIGPAAQFIGTQLASAVNIMFDKWGILASLLYGAFYSLIVVTGLQHGMVPILVDSISRYGFNHISPASGSSNMGQAGAAFGVWLRSKDKDTKAVAASACISALSGVTEPAIYGVNLRLKKPFLYAGIGGAAGGLLAGILKAKCYALGGPSFLTLPMFIGDPNNVWYVVAAFIVAFIVSALCTIIFGFEEMPLKED